MDIPTKHAQPAPRCKSTCFCGQKLLLHFHLFPDMFDDLQRGHLFWLAPGGSTEKAVAPEQAYLKLELLGNICRFHPKHPEPITTVADQHAGLLLVQVLSTDTLQDLTPYHAKKVSLL